MTDDDQRAALARLHNDMAAMRERAEDAYRLMAEERATARLSRETVQVRLDKIDAKLEQQRRRIEEGVVFSRAGRAVMAIIIAIGGAFAVVSGWASDLVQSLRS